MTRLVVYFTTLVFVLGLSEISLHVTLARCTRHIWIRTGCGVGHPGSFHMLAMDRGKLTRMVMESTSINKSPLFTMQDKNHPMHIDIPPSVSPNGGEQGTGAESGQQVLHTPNSNPDFKRESCVFVLRSMECPAKASICDNRDSSRNPQECAFWHADWRAEMDRGSSVPTRGETPS